MNAKSVSFERPVKAATNVDAWVGDDQPKPTIEIKRITVDVPADLHRRMKAGCARQGQSMSDAIRPLLEDAFPGD